MTYLVVGSIMNEFRWALATTAQEACDVADAMHVSSRMIVDHDLKTWTVEALRETLEPATDA